MAEKLVTYNPGAILEGAKRILKGGGCLPANCPKETCLHLKGVSLTDNETWVFINARPPQLPTRKPGLEYEIDPICGNYCEIFGNPYRGFEVRQDSQTGRVISAKGQWLSERH